MYIKSLRQQDKKLPPFADTLLNPERTFLYLTFYISSKKAMGKKLKKKHENV